MEESIRARITSYTQQVEDIKEQTFHSWTPFNATVILISINQSINQVDHDLIGSVVERKLSLRRDILASLRMLYSRRNQYVGRRLSGKVE